MPRTFFDLIVPGVLTGIFGLVGVLVGGWIANRGQKQQRQDQYVREQLESFYYPMLGLRAKMVAKSQVRTKVSGAVDAAWRKLVQQLESVDPGQLSETIHSRSPDFEKAIEENNRELIEGILPLYRQMVETFSANMGLAESSTREYFGALVEFIDIWDRWLKGTLAKEVLDELKHSEDKLGPFYRDLFDQLDRLQKQLKE